MDDVASDEMFAPPLPMQHATVGDVMNLDGISQDSVPLDDTASTEGLILEADLPPEVGGGSEAAGEAGGEMEAAEEAKEVTEVGGSSETTDDGVASREDGPGDKIGSPKPFDASLFGGSAPPPESTSADDFPIQAPVLTSLTQDADSNPDGDVEEEEEEEEKKMGPLAVDVQRKPPADGFESQPIGSPGSHFQFAEAAGLFAEGHQEVSVATVVTPTAVAGQPSISSFFDEAGVVESVGDADGKRFFDSFTSGGSGNEDGFPRSVSVESPRSESDAPLMVSAGGTTEIDLEPLDGPEPKTQPAVAAETDLPSTTFETAPTLSPPAKQTTLLELAKQGGLSDRESGSQTSPQSPSAEVTSPHLCKVEGQAEGQPARVAFTKVDATVVRPNALGGSTAPIDASSESQGVVPAQPTAKASPGDPRPAHTPSPQLTPQPTPQPTPFAVLGPPRAGEEDVFAAAISTSHSDRRQDAWLPSAGTQEVLANRILALQGTEFVDRALLTMPGIVLEDPQGDPVKDLMCRYVGEVEASKRVALTADQVTRDEAGLKRLLDAGCLRAAVDLTGYMLTSLGQGKGQAGMLSKHTPQSLQIWLTRLALLVKLQQHSMAEVECEAFGNLDQPDLYFEYYPDLYPGRQGTMVPFSFRVLHAELPGYLGKYQDSLNRLYHLLDVTKQILFNLESGMSEYGTEMELTKDDRTASIDLWKSREVRVLYSIGRCLLLMKDFNQAVSVYESLLGRDCENSSRLLSGIGRIFLQLGDLKAAQEAYNRAEASYNGAKDVQSQSVILMNKAFMHMAQCQYAEARTVFTSLLELDPKNFTAINNQSVCLLYMGQLKDALGLLESLVRDDPATYLDESLLFNLCTLYELDSSRSAAKKQSLLDLVGRHRGDGFNVGCLKMI